MPGIFGVVNSANLEHDIENMVAEMHGYVHFVRDEVYCDDRLAASRIHTGQIGELQSPSSHGGSFLWLEGEAYNVEHVARSLAVNARSLADLLLVCNANGLLEKCLNCLDGYFCAAIYDPKRAKLKLISDRDGMRMLYWYSNNSLFCWGSEVKALLAVDGVKREIDGRSFECFMEQGHLVGEHTWIVGVKLVRPASVLTYDLNCRSVSQNPYWSWGEILPSALSFDDAVEEVGLRFIDSVRRRFNPNERVGISLSGGLDSRAILAAVDYLYPDYQGYAYTFGIPRCDDIKIAEETIAKTRCWRHEKFNFSENNWFETRIKKVWDTDGMLDMMHMHGSEFSETIANEIDINLNGFLGDAVLGGSYLRRADLLNTRVNELISRDAYGRFAEGYHDSRYDIDHYDVYYFGVRGRRFINYGTVNLLPWCSQRLPFFDVGLLNLVYSLPDEYRYRNRLYSAMLRKFFPKFFVNIPWQRTGKPVSIIEDPSLVARALQKGGRAIQRIFGVKTRHGYTNYPSWIRRADLAKKLESLLGNESAAYKVFLDENLADKLLKPHLNDGNKDYSAKILRAATAELYLQRVVGSGRPN